METDVAFAVFALLALRVGSGDPQQRLAVAPAGHVVIVMFELEAEKRQHFAVKFLGPREVADAQNQMVDADDARHGMLRSCDALTACLERRGRPRYAQIW